jgi:hypothetical protein
MAQQQPPAPTGVTTIPGPASVSIEWIDGGPCGCHVHHYEIWRSTCSCADTLYTTVGGSATYFVDAYLPGGVTYTYRVRAVNDDGTLGVFSSGSGTMPGPGDPPPAPASLTATPGPEQVMLDWSPASPCGCIVSTYEIWRGTCGGCPKVLLIVVGPSVTIYVDNRDVLAHWHCDRGAGRAPDRSGQEREPRRPAAGSDRHVSARGHQHRLRRARWIAGVGHDARSGDGRRGAATSAVWSAAGPPDRVRHAVRLVRHGGQSGARGQPDVHAHRRR